MKRFESRDVADNRWVLSFADISEELHRGAKVKLPCWWVEN